MLRIFTHSCNTCIGSIIAVTKAGGAPIRETVVSSVVLANQKAAISADKVVSSQVSLNQAAVLKAIKEAADAVVAAPAAPVVEVVEAPPKGYIYTFLMVIILYYWIIVITAISADNYSIVSERVST